MKQTFVKIGSHLYPFNRVPIHMLEAFRARYKGAVIYYRGPRRSAGGAGYKNPDCLKEDATHFFVAYAYAAFRRQ